MKKKYKKMVSLGYDVSGKRIRKWAYGDTKRELENNIHELRDKFSGKVQEKTFYEYAIKYIDVYKGKKSQSTYNSAMHYLNKCVPLFRKNLDDISDADCQQIINDCWDAPESARQLDLLLKQIFGQLVRNGRLRVNPASDLQRPKVKKIRKDRCLTEEEKSKSRELIFGEDLTPQHRMFVAVLYYFGLRPEEARGLVKQDFDLENESVTIQRAVAFGSNQPIVKGTKTDNVRTMPIPRTIMPQIRVFLSQTEEYLFTQKNGLIHSRTTYRRMWDKIKEYIGSDDLIPYHYRKTYATTLYYSHISPKKSAYLMGHTDVRIMLKYYAQIDDENEPLDELKNME